jgi:hypothetical protein
MAPPPTAAQLLAVYTIVANFSPMIVAHLINPDLPPNSSTSFNLFQEKFGGLTLTWLVCRIAENVAALIRLPPAGLGAG